MVCPLRLHGRSVIVRNAVGLRVNAGRLPTEEELKAILAGRGVISIELDEAPSEEA